MGTVGRKWSKKVRHIESGVIYDNVRSAAEGVGMSYSAVYRRLSGETQFRHGYREDFEWVE